MTRSIDPTLEAALPTAAGNFICKVEFKRTGTSATVTVVRAFEIDEGRLTAWVRIPTVYKPTTVNPSAQNDTIFRISRGLNILGTDYYFASSWFVVQSIEFTDKDIIYRGHLFASNRTVTPGDVEADKLIDDVMDVSYVAGLGYENAVTYPTDTPWWKDIQFYPDGRSFVLQNIQNLNSILQQKYILNLVDIGGNVLVPHDNGQMNEYEPTDPVINPITSVVDFAYIHAKFPVKYYIWRDEANTLHTSGISTNPMHNLGYIESTVTPFALDEYLLLKATVKLAPPDLRLTVQDYIVLDSLTGVEFADWFRIKETFNPDAKIPWYQTLESMNLLNNTEGGTLPSTIEAAAPYTPLATGNFNNILSANENNIQAAMEKIDDHTHATPTPAEVGAIPNDGWIAVAETWTRTGNHTFTVSGDVTAAYRKGAKVRYKDGGSNEYGVIGSSSHAAGTTTVNLIPNTNYTMAAATITDRYISYIENPEGFPDAFNYAVTWGGFSSDPTNVTAQWSVIKGMLLGKVVGLTPGTSDDTVFTVTVPVALSGTRFIRWCRAMDNNVWKTAPMALLNSSSSTMEFYTDAAGTGWTNSGNKTVEVDFNYAF